MNKPIDYLKQQIEFRYRIMQYKKLHRNWLLNRMEKNNVHIMHEGIEQILQRKY